MKVIQIAQKQILYTYERFEGFWSLSCDLKIDPMMFEPHQVPFYKLYL